MSQQKTRQEIIASLPPEIQRAIEYSNLGSKINKIGEKHSLHVDKIGALYATTDMVMLGLTHPNNFVTSIRKKLEVSQGVAEMIARDVNNEIFLAIRESLKKLAEQAPLLEEEGAGTTNTTLSDDKTSNLAPDSEHPVETDEHHATLKREDILRDIEDPAPTTLARTVLTLARTVLAKNDIEDPAPITLARTIPARNNTVASPAVAKTSPAPSNLPVAHNDNDLPAIVPQNNHSYPTPPQTQPAPKTPAAPANNIVSAKLSGVVVTATTVISQKPSVPATPYKSDPYRETFLI